MTDWPNFTYEAFLMNEGQSEHPNLISLLLFVLKSTVIAWTTAASDLAINPGPNGTLSLHIPLITFRTTVKKLARADFVSLSFRLGSRMLNGFK